MKLKLYWLTELVRIEGKRTETASPMKGRELIQKEIKQVWTLTKTNLLRWYLHGLIGHIFYNIINK